MNVNKKLAYGENPHQEGYLNYNLDSPIAWDSLITEIPVSYNNISDVSVGYTLVSELLQLTQNFTSVVIIKHSGPCGVASVPKYHKDSQKLALMKAWEGDPVSAFGSVVVFSDPLEVSTAHWLKQFFVEVVAAPKLAKGHATLQILMEKRKNLKAFNIDQFGVVLKELRIHVPGGILSQEADSKVGETLKSVTECNFPVEKHIAANFGIVACRALKSNAIAIVREVPGTAGSLQLIGTGQGQPNRVDALKKLAIPRAIERIRENGGQMQDCILISDGFFPFRDSILAAHEAGIRWIVQQGGSIKDRDTIAVCNELGIGMAFTSIRHFKN